jgi:hypothetical protein
MNIEVGFATTEAQKEGVYALRYRVSVEELKAYQDIADHARKHLKRSCDKTGHIIYATVDGEYAGTLVINWGGDAPFEEETRQLYKLDPFLERVPAREIITTSGLVVLPQHRKTGLLFHMLAKITEFSNQHAVQLIFLECRPHLLNLYRKMGFRSYTRTVHHAYLGLMVPLVMVVEDVAHLESVGSPILAFRHTRELTSQVPKLVADLLPPDAAAPGLEAAQEWTRLAERLSQEAEDRIGIFDGVAQADVDRVLAQSNIIECQRGDEVIRKGSVERTVFVVLSGSVEVREENRVVAALSPGEVLGGSLCCAASARQRFCSHRQHPHPRPERNHLAQAPDRAAGGCPAVPQPGASWRSVWYCSTTGPSRWGRDAPCLGLPSAGAAVYRARPIT